MKRSRIIASTLLAMILLILWAALSITLVAPRPGRALFDTTTAFLGLGDLETRCSDRETGERGTVIGHVGARACYAFSPARRFRGIFIDEFEGQLFLEGVAPARQYRLEHRVWLGLDEHSDLRKTPALQRGRKEVSQIWQVDFVGRETSTPGQYGHLGGSDALVLVDRTLQARLLSSYEGYAPNSVLTR